MTQESFEKILQEFNEENDNPSKLDEETSGLPLIDAIDHHIIMHRDVHFGGKFSFMLKYYEEEGKGIQDEFDIKRIKQLADIEKKLGTDIAGNILTGSEAEEIARAREAYKKLRNIYEISQEHNSAAYLIADLILSEEENPQKEIENILEKGDDTILLLIDLLNSEEFRNPLFPGYGLAPALAAHCLGKLKSPQAIEQLFFAIDKDDFFLEDTCLQALGNIGAPAKAFLLNRLQSTPITSDNTKAAIALIEFKDNDVIKTCKDFLKNLDHKKHANLIAYIRLILE